jgi:hypothetical protein
VHGVSLLVQVLAREEGEAAAKISPNLFIEGVGLPLHLFQAQPDEMLL